MVVVKVTLITGHFTPVMHKHVINSNWGVIIYSPDVFKRALIIN